MSSTHGQLRKTHLAVGFLQVPSKALFPPSMPLSVGSRQQPGFNQQLRANHFQRFPFIPESSLLSPFRRGKDTVPLACLTGPQYHSTPKLELSLLLPLKSSLFLVFPHLSMTMPPSTWLLLETWGPRLTSFSTLDGHPPQHTTDRFTLLKSLKSLRFSWTSCHQWDQATSISHLNYNSLLNGLRHPPCSPLTPPSTWQQNCSF